MTELTTDRLMITAELTQTLYIPLGPRSNFEMGGGVGGGGITISDLILVGGHKTLFLTMLILSAF